MCASILIDMARGTTQRKARRARQRHCKQTYAGKQGTRAYLIVTGLLNQTWHKHHSLILRQLIALQIGILQ